MVESIIAELFLQKNYLNGEKIKTIYYGGGTPSVLSTQELTSVFFAIRNNFTLISDPEITLEANPDDLTPAQLHALRAAGINRLSIGIQSFHDTILTYLNRAHNGKLAERSVIDARQAGFNNISVDLIYAIPGQSDNDWIENIQRVIDLNPEHISAYSLTIEKKTVFGHWAIQGMLKAVDDDRSAHQLELLIAMLEDAGYEQYEVSNFCRPGYLSRHNSSYWKGEKYLGVGPSAHSYNGISRQFNSTNNADYVRLLSRGEIPFQMEVLTRENHINEYLMTTLRTSWGCELEKLREHFNYDIHTIHSAYIGNLLNEKLAVIDGTCLKLTKKGRFMADKIASDLFVLTD